MKIAGATLILGGLLLCGCSQDIQNKEAVRQGIIEHLSSNTGLDLASMDVEVTSVMFREGEADATVAFRAKGSAEAAAMLQMQYTLEQQGGRWVVLKKAESGESPHGEGGGAMPPGHPPVEQPAPQGDAP